MNVIKSFLDVVCYVFKLGADERKSLATDILKNERIVQSAKDGVLTTENSAFQFDGKLVCARLVPIFLNWGLQMIPKILKDGKMVQNNKLHSLVEFTVGVRCRSVCARLNVPLTSLHDTIANALEIIYGACEYTQIVRPYGYSETSPLVRRWYDANEEHERTETFRMFHILNREKIPVISRLTEANILELELAAIAGNWVSFRTGVDKLPKLVGIQQNIIYTACSMAVRHVTILTLGTPSRNNADPQLLAEIQAEDDLNPFPSISEIWEDLRPRMSDKELAVFDLRIESLGKAKPMEFFQENCSSLGMKSIQTPYNILAKTKRKLKKIIRELADKRIEEMAK